MTFGSAFAGIGARSGMARPEDRGGERNEAEL